MTVRPRSRYWDLGKELPKCEITPLETWCNYGANLACFSFLLEESIGPIQRTLH
jgi:hypothetical protein